MSACRTTPTPTLPRKRERERTSSASSLSRKRESYRTSFVSSLSRLRGRVARSSERDGWGRTWLQTFAQAA